MTRRPLALLPLAVLLAIALPGSSATDSAGGCTTTRTIWFTGTFQQDLGQPEETHRYAYLQLPGSRRLDVTFLPEPIYPQGFGLGTQWVTLTANAGGNVNLGAAGRSALAVVFEPDVPGALARISVTAHYGGPLDTLQDGLPYEPYKIRVTETVPC